VYMPMQMPLVGALPGMAAAGVQQSVELGNPLEAAHRAELLAHRATVAQAELQATIDAHNRVLQRIVNAGVKSSSCNTTPSDLDTRLTNLATDLDKLNTRVSAIEKLLIIHDNVLRAKVVGPGSSPGGSSGGGGGPAVDPAVSGANPGVKGTGTDTKTPAGPTTATPPPMIPPAPTGK
jgi:hypothetical protein